MLNKTDKNLLTGVFVLKWETGDLYVDEQDYFRFGGPACLEQLGITDRFSKGSS